jgi:dipeptidyl aminopeptidase/acylaminoacyl peptidase
VKAPQALLVAGVHIPRAHTIAWPLWRSPIPRRMGTTCYRRSEICTLRRRLLISNVQTQAEHRACRNTDYVKALWVLPTALVLVACSAGQSNTAPQAPSATSTAAVSAPRQSPAPTATSSNPTPTPKVTKTPKAHPVSMHALINKKYDGRDLKLGRVLGDYGAYKRYLITYRGDGLKISGVMNVPDGKGPFPVLVLNHGYIDPDTYFPGQGMPREHDYLARHGYVVLHTDYRGHASSENDPNVDYELRLPYAVDTINAVKAVKSSKLPFFDKDRVGWLGRSMGGGVTLTALVAQPGLVDAAVIYASVSSLAADNWKQFYRPSADRSRTNRRIARTYGLPDDSPEFWRAASPRPYFDRISEPVLVHHGTRDDTCPIRWSEGTVKALRAAGKDVTFVKYRGEGHTFERQWHRSIERTLAFFDKHLE